MYLNRLICCGLVSLMSSWILLSSVSLFSGFPIWVLPVLFCCFSVSCTLSLVLFPFLLSSLISAVPRYSGVSNFPDCFLCPFNALVSISFLFSYTLTLLPSLALCYFSVSLIFHVVSITFWGFFYLSSPSLKAVFGSAWNPWHLKHLEVTGSVNYNYFNVIFA